MKIRITLCLLLAAALTSCDRLLASDEVQAVYSYTVKAYYLDGGSRVITMKGLFPPKVRCYKGSYWLETKYGYNGAISMCESAVCRYDLLHTENITAEYYNSEVEYSRTTEDGIIIYRLVEGKEVAL